MKQNLTERNHDQVLCTFCEEMIHRFAPSCPYCNTLQNLEKKVESTMFEQDLPNSHKTHATTQHVLPTSYSLYSESETKDQRQQDLQTLQQARSFKTEASQDMTHLVIALIALLSGSFFIFFGLVLKLFSQNGFFVLQWSESSWPYFLFPAFILLLIGFFFSSSQEKETHFNEPHSTEL